ncbi:MAG: helix-turn-helix domain-containing protein [Candidatus Omnitrophica bacterium]|nr:helix-turn-helix domain-containing protein [Candidatus Omnitrophota bacterium]
MRIQEEYLTVPQVAELLKISKVAVYKRIKIGTLVAVRMGRNYLVPKDQANPLQRPLTEADKRQVEKHVKKTFRDYGDVLKWLAKE